MAAAVRPGKPQKKPFPEPPNSARRPPAWGNRASPTFNQNARPAANGQNGFPPIASDPASASTRSNDRIVPLDLAGVVGTLIIVHVRGGTTYEGTLGSTTNEGVPGIRLKDAKELSNPSAPAREIDIPIATLEKWEPHSGGAKPPNVDSFRTDGEIAAKIAAPPKMERKLFVWADDNDELTNSVPIASAKGDDATFGLPSAPGQWDQFEANEKLFGISSKFDEDEYTTKLDRSRPDFKERERKAQQLADEITGMVTINPHIADERGQRTDDSGMNEEDKFGAVVRGPNAYVPPAARRTNPGASPMQTPTGPAPDGKRDIPKVSINPPDTVSPSATPVPASKAPSSTPPKSPASTTSTVKPPADPLPAFRDFVTNEKQRLTQKRAAIVKNEMAKRKAELVEFSQRFKLKQPIPDDLVPILAKDTEKQKAIRDKAHADAESAQARAIGHGTSNSSNPAMRLPPAVGVTASTAKPDQQKPVKATDSTLSTAPAKSAKPPIVIQAIPPFRGGRSRDSTANPKTNDGTSSAAPASNGPTASSSVMMNGPQFKMNTRAPTFNPKAAGPSSTPTKPITNGSNPSTPAATGGKPSETAQPNAFFGVRVTKKSGSGSLREDFNPFKHNKVAEPNTINGIWPYQGKKYMLLFPVGPPPGPHQHHHPVPHPGPTPQPQYEEEPNLRPQGAYTVYYSPYPYPPQPMMGGMPQGAPPGQFMPQFIPGMQYPAMSPNGPPMGYPPAMTAIPPPQHYMQGPPPPGPYPPPPPNGGPRPAMAPSPIPHPQQAYYHPSPHMQHAVPYPMMMPPQPPNGPPMAYEGVPQGAPIGHA